MRPETALLTARETPGPGPGRKAWWAGGAAGRAGQTELSRHPQVAAVRREELPQREPWRSAEAPPRGLKLRTHASPQSGGLGVTGQGVRGKSPLSAVRIKHRNVPREQKDEKSPHAAVSQQDGLRRTPTTRGSAEGAMGPERQQAPRNVILGDRIEVGLQDEFIVFKEIFY